jgi:cytochrome c-type biogenesis protein CcmH/NrfG
VRVLLEFFGTLHNMRDQQQRTVTTEMSNRRRMFVGVAGFLAIVIGGSFFIWQQKAKMKAQPPAEKAITSNDSQVSVADPQHQVSDFIHAGDRMMEDGDYGNARSYYEAALKLAPSNAEARARTEIADRAIAKDSAKHGEN